MEQNNDLAMGYVMGRDNNGWNNGCGYMGGFGGFGNGMWGDSWLAIFLILALLGGNGWGGFGGNNGGNVGYELGKLATTNDVASGFSTSAIMSDLNDILLGQTQGFAAVQQTLCQGFSGVNQTVMNGFHGVDNAICNLGYQAQNGFNSIGRQISDCCCDLKTMNLENRYLNEKQSCDLKNAIYNSTRDIIDSNRCGFDRIAGMLNEQEMDRLRAENQTLKFERSQANQTALFNANQEAQTAELLRRLGRDCPTAAYLVPNPNCCYDQAALFSSYGYNRSQNGCCCG